MGSMLYHCMHLLFFQMEEEGVPSTTLREISLLQMLSESNFIVKWVQCWHFFDYPRFHECRFTVLQAFGSGAHRREQQALSLSGEPLG